MRTRWFFVTLKAVVRPRIPLDIAEVADNHATKSLRRDGKGQATAKTILTQTPNAAMRNFLIFMALAFSTTLSAQIKKDAVDEFTGEREVVTERVRIVDGRWYTLTVELTRIGEKDYLACNFWANRRFTIKAGETMLYLKFDDGTIGKAICTEDGSSSMTGVQIRERHAKFLCQPDSELINKLATNRVTRFRFTASFGDVEYEVGSKRSRQLQEQAIAFTELLYKN